MQSTAACPKDSCGEAGCQFRAADVQDCSLRHHRTIQTWNTSPAHAYSALRLHVHAELKRQAKSWIAVQSRMEHLWQNQWSNRRALSSKLVSSSTQTRFSCKLPCRQGSHGPTVGALNAESPKRFACKTSKNEIGHEISVFLTDLHNVLHERSCNHFQWFRILPCPLGP